MRDGIPILIRRLADKIQNSNRGLTMVELIVVIAVFMLVVSVAIVIFISIINSQRIILSRERLLGQVSYATEYMSKALRMASKDTGGNCLVYTDVNYNITDTFPGYIYLYTRPNNWYKGIKFINESNYEACQEFYLDESGGNVLKEKRINFPYEQVVDENSVSLISDEFNIDYLRFSINGTSGLESDLIYGASEDDDPLQQPRVTIIMGIQSPEDPLQSEIKIQTTISQRNLNAK
jgi:type II secretory pathway pseudopilin PulG